MHGSIIGDEHWVQPRRTRVHVEMNVFSVIWLHFVFGFGFREGLWAVRLGFSGSVTVAGGGSLLRVFFDFFLLRRLRRPPINL